MTSGWSEDRKARQAELIRRWRPWEQSTGPSTEEGKASSSKNSFKGGIRPAARRLARLLKKMEKRNEGP